MEITKPINLVDKKGNINFSWARKPIICANIEDSKFNKNFLSILSLKKWDFYYLAAEDFIFSTMIVDTGLVGFSGLIFL